MKKLTTTFVLAIFGYCSLFAQTWGGPDTYGYKWYNSNDTTVFAPVYSWIDITTIGTEITGLGDDNVSVIFPFGFTFKYYWSDISSFSVGSNGYIALNTSYTISSGPDGFPPTPTVDGKENVIAPFMSDLRFDEGGGPINPSKAYYYSNLVDTLIVSFENVAFWVGAAPGGWAGSNTFQVIFTSTDSSITFQYKKQQGSWDPAYDGVLYPGITGIENITEQIGLLVSTWSPAKLDTLLAIKFYYPDSVTLSVEDVKPSWTNNAANAGFFEIVNRSVNITTNVSNVGNVDINTSFNAFIDILRSNNTIAYNDAVSIPSLVQGNNTTFVYPTIYTPDMADIYSINTFTNLSSDINTLNDQIQTEMVVIDTAGKTQDTLSWDNGMVPGQGIGFEGCGVHFVPPFYPVDVKELLYFVIQTGVDSNGFIARVWDDDGPGGTAGTILFSDTVIPTSVILNAWNSVNLPVPVTINDGGFYISWQATGPIQGNAVGTDLTPPFSLRTYEVLSGSWGAYRSAESEDIMINAVIGLPAPVPAPPVANFTQSANAICAGDTIQFSNTSVGADSILWAFPGGTPGSDTAQSVNVTYPGAGVYTVALFAYNAAGSDTITRTVNVDIPVAGFTLSANTISVNDTLWITNNSTDAASYLWIFGDGDSSTVMSPSHVYTVADTSFIITLIAVGPCGSDTTQKTIIITSPLGIAPGSKYSFELGQNYPNPANKETSIHYSLNKTSDVTFTLSNIIGKEVKKYTFSNIPAGKHQLVIIDLHPGIYFYSMRVEGNVITKKMIITQR